MQIGTEKMAWRRVLEEGRKLAECSHRDLRKRMVNTATPQKDETSVCIVSDNWEVMMTSA